jgi:hypothetical protein
MSREDRSEERQEPSAPNEEPSAPDEEPSAPNEEPSAPNEEPSASRKEQEEKQGMGLAQVVGSVFAAGLGVQSSRNRERDFKQGRAVTFIIAGLIFTALFIGGVYTVVSLVLNAR